MAVMIVLEIKTVVKSNIKTFKKQLNNKFYDNDE